MNYTTHTLCNAKPIAFEQGRKDVTRISGMGFAIPTLRNRKYLNPFAEFLDRCLPRRRPQFRFTNLNILEQMFVSGIAGAPHFQDAVNLAADPVFSLICSEAGVASPATLCRFVNRIERACLKEQTAALNACGKRLDELEKTDPIVVQTSLTRELNLILLDSCLRILRTRDPQEIVIDVDGTPVPLFGQQNQRAYDGHYGCTCYLPVLATINGLPAYVQNAPGAANGAKLVNGFIEELLVRVKQMFPGKLVVVRADTGFNNTDLIAKIEAQSCRYIIGNNACGGKYQTEALVAQVREDYEQIADRDGIPQRVLSFFCPEHFVLANPVQLKPGQRPRIYRACGFLRGYQAKSWKTPRTVAYRLQYNEAFEEKDSAVNLRFIQSNLSEQELMQLAQGRGLKKGRASPQTSLEPDLSEAEKAAEIYESVFCDRGMDERLNCEWKSHCFASNCSCSGFFANSVRMIFSAVQMLGLAWLRMDLFDESTRPQPKKRRHSAKPNVTRAHQADKRHVGPTLQSIRYWLINVPAVVKIRARQIFISMAPVSPFWQQAMKRLAYLS